MSSFVNSILKMSFTCEKCTGEYSSKKSLKRHSRICTGVKRQRPSVTRGSPAPMKCPECKESFVNLDPLRTHIEENHNVKMEKETLFFKTMSDFLSWKENIEKEINSAYRGKGTSWTNTVERKYFFCHRSGYSKTKPQVVRRQLSVKIDATCPSAMVMVESANGVDVTYYKTHFGHALGLKRCLTDDERESIAIRIGNGACFEEILDGVNDRTSNLYDPKTLTTKQDLLNIIQEFNCRITSVHNDSKRLLPQIKFQKISDISWTIESSSEKHAIIQIKKECDVKNCSFKCRFCKICSHMYICDCIDHISKPKITICKHIHACVFKLNSLRLQTWWETKNNATQSTGKPTGSSDNAPQSNQAPQPNQRTEQPAKVTIYYPDNGNCSKINVSM